MSDSDTAPEAHATAIDGSTAQPMTRSRQRAQAADAGSEHGGDRRAAGEENEALARAERRRQPAHPHTRDGGLNLSSTRKSE